MMCSVEGPRYVQENLPNGLVVDPLVDVHYDVQCRRPEVSGSCLRKIEYDVLCRRAELG